MKKLTIIILAITVLIGCSKEAEEELTKIEYDSVEELMEDISTHTKSDINNMVYTILEDDILDEVKEIGYNQEYPQNPSDGYIYLIIYLAENELYCNKMSGGINLRMECEIDDYTLAPTRTYVGQYSKTTEYPAGLVAKKQGDDYEIVATYSTSQTDMIDNAAGDITIMLTSEEGTDEYNQARDRLHQVHKDNEGGGDYSDFLTMSSLRANQTQIEELSNMTPQEIVENYEDYEKALMNIKTSIGL